MSTKKVIAVVGATGLQGGSLVRAILKSTSFEARALTRDTSSLHARALERICEFVEVDIFKTIALARTLEGAYGMFCVTTSHQDPKQQILQAKSMASAAKKAGVKHVVWSTLEDTRKFYPHNSTAKDEYRVPDFDVKGESDQFFADLPTTYMLTSFCWENFLRPECEFLKKAHHGSLTLEMPMGTNRIPGIGTEDIGKCALSFFKNPKDFVNKRVGIASEHLTVSEMATKMSTILQREINCLNNVKLEGLRNLGRRNNGERYYANMFEFYRNFERELCESRSVAESLKLNPEMLTFNHWLIRHKDELFQVLRGMPSVFEHI